MEEDIEKRRMEIEARLSAIVNKSVENTHKLKGTGELKLTPNDLENCSFEDPGAEPIWLFFVEYCRQQQASCYMDKEFQALEKLSPELRYVCLLLRYELMWSNGGTQHAALMDDLESSKKLLEMTASAYAHYGDSRREGMMMEIISLLEEHQTTLDEADRAGMLEDYASPLDRYDGLWEAVEFNYLAAIKREIEAHPQDYQHPRQ